MAVITQILLSVYRDRNAPFDNTTNKTHYPTSIGRSFHISTIKGIRNVTENSVVYGSFIHQRSDGSIPEEILTIQASGAIITLCNS